MDTASHHLRAAHSGIETLRTRGGPLRRFSRPRSPRTGRSMRIVVGAYRALEWRRPPCGCHERWRRTQTNTSAAKATSNPRDLRCRMRCHRRALRWRSQPAAARSRTHRNGHPAVPGRRSPAFLWRSAARGLLDRRLCGPIRRGAEHREPSAVDSGGRRWTSVDQETHRSGVCGLWWTPVDAVWIPISHRLRCAVTGPTGDVIHL